MIGRTPATSCGAPAQGRGDHRLRDHPAHDPPPLPAGRGLAPVPGPGAHLRAVRDHARRAAGRAGSGPEGRSGRHLPARAAHGGGDRRRPSHPRAAREHGRRRGWRHHRGRGHLPRRDGRAGGRAGRILRHRLRHPGLRPARVRDRHRRAHRRGDQAGDRLGVPHRGRVQGRGPRPRPHDRPAEGDHPVARGGPRRHRGAGAGHRATPSSPRWPGRTRAGPDLILQGIHLVAAAACSGAWPAASLRRRPSTSTSSTPRSRPWCSARSLHRAVRPAARDVHASPRR